MRLHLKKLCVGCEDIRHLEKWQWELCERLAKAGEEALILPFHDTRNFPRRTQDLHGGSLYWIKRSRFFARQKIHLLQPRHDENGKKFCRIWLDMPLIAVESMPHRPFQGWRYLKLIDAPADSADGHQDIETELKRIGLLTS